MSQQTCYVLYEPAAVIILGKNDESTHIRSHNTTNRQLNTCPNIDRIGRPNCVENFFQLFYCIYLAVDS